MAQVQSVKELEVDSRYTSGSGSGSTSWSESTGRVNVSFDGLHDNGDSQKVSTVSASIGDNAEGQTPAERRVVYGPPNPKLFDRFPAAAETALQIGFSVFVPFLFAGLGMVLAGLLLDRVQHWPVFVEVDELFVMVPALLGLKGNLEMTSASRLSTAANVGKMKNFHAWWIMASGSISITQAQSIVVGLLAGIVATLLSFLQEWSVEGFTWQYFTLLLCSGVVTSSIASLFLDSLMIALITVCHRYNINPDNVALPVAASLGDIGTLTILTAVATLLFNILETHFWVLPTVIAILVLLFPVWLFSARRNEFVRQVTSDGWVPVISAMLISSIGGVIMKDIVSTFEYVALYQPLMNGVGGNLAGIQASRLSTRLHQLFDRPGSLDWRRLTISVIPPETTVEEQNELPVRVRVVIDDPDQSEANGDGEARNANEQVNSIEADTIDRVNQEIMQSASSQELTQENHVGDDYKVVIRPYQPQNKSSVSSSVVLTELAADQLDKDELAKIRKRERRERCDSTAVRTIGTYLDPLDQGIILQRGCPNPYSTFFGGTSLSRASQILMALLIPGELVFLFIIYGIHPDLVYSVAFVCFFILAALIHLIILLYFTHWIIQQFWRIGRDPDNFAVPFITAVGDVLGALLIAACFWSLRALNDPMAREARSSEHSSESNLTTFSTPFESSTTY